VFLYRDVRKKTADERNMNRFDVRFFGAIVDVFGKNCLTKNYLCYTQSTVPTVRQRSAWFW
jgi:hypothetical protein